MKKIGLDFYWNANITNLTDLLKLANREVRFFGITIFQIGIGFIVSVKVKP